MNKAANTYWIDARLAAQRPEARALMLPSTARTESGNAVAVAPERVVARRNSFSVPSWVFFCMIMFATFAVCVTVTMRTHAEMRTAEHKLQSVSSEVERMRGTNESLRREAERLRTDPRAIEAAARTRLNMVRANEVVVPLN